MQPTIKAGDYLLCNQLYYRYHNPQWEDLVIFKFPQGENIEFIKRIVGIPGDNIELKGIALFVNSRKIDKPVNASGAFTGNFGPFIVPENE